MGIIIIANTKGEIYVGTGNVSLGNRSTATLRAVQTRINTHRNLSPKGIKSKGRQPLLIRKNESKIFGNFSKLQLLAQQYNVGLKQQVEPVLKRQAQI